MLIILLIFFKPMPYPKYTIDDFLVYVSFILPFMMMTAFVLTVSLFTKVGAVSVQYSVLYPHYTVFIIMISGFSERKRI